MCSTREVSTLHRARLRSSLRRSHRGRSRPLSCGFRRLQASRGSAWASGPRMARWWRMWIAEASPSLVPQGAPPEAPRQGTRLNQEDCDMRVLSAAAALLFAFAPAQERPQEQGFSFRSNVDLINVTVTVTDTNGHFVSGLKRE